MTWTRILAIPFLVWVFRWPVSDEMRNTIATCMFVVFALTDWLDGFLARKLNQTSAFGAFLDWGLDKDLLAPKIEQHRPMERDKSYIVYVKRDNKERLIASSKLDYFLDKVPAQYNPGDEVSLLISETTTMGTKVIINDKHWGLIHASDIFQPLSYGKRIKGYIKTVRDDGKIDVVLRKMGQDNTNDLAQHILSELHKMNGFLPLHDKSPPQEIMRVFNDSKKNFKNAIGKLYKNGEITLEPDGIRIRNKQM